MVPTGTSVIALSTKTRSMPSQNMIIDPDQISSDSVDIAHRVFALFRVMLYSKKKIHIYIYLPSFFVFSFVPSPLQPQASQSSQVSEFQKLGAIKHESCYYLFLT